MLASVFKKIHTSPSRTFACFAAMFCFGILLGPLVISISTDVFVVCLAVCILCYAFTSPNAAPSPFEGEGGGRGVTSVFARDTFRLLSLCLFFFIFGLFRYAQSEIPKNIPTVRDYVGSSIRVEGDVMAEPSIGKSQQVTIGYVRVADKPVFGNVLVSVSLDQQIVFNDHLVFSCAMQIPRPFGGFAYGRYLQAKGTLALCRFPHDLERTAPQGDPSFVGMTRGAVSSILSFKHGIIDKMKHLFPEPHASFLFGLVFGGNVGLDRETQNEFRETGTSHILAASGFNVSLFTFVFFGWIVQYLGRKRGATATAILLLVYVMMAGATAAVVRAAIFGSVLLIGSTIGRRASVVNTLLLTASLMLFYNPRWLLDDVGFQLSFVAFAAIIFVAPRLETHLEFIPEHLGIRNALAGSLSAIVLTLPIILWQFGSISLVAPFANIFVLPLVPFLMFYTIAILPIAWIVPSIGRLIALPALFGSKYIVAIISIFASPTFASVSVPSAHIFAIIATVFLAIASVAYFRKP